MLSAIAFRLYFVFVRYVMIAAATGIVTTVRAQRLHVPYFCCFVRYVFFTV